MQPRGPFQGDILLRGLGAPSVSGFIPRARASGSPGWRNGSGARAPLPLPGPNWPVCFAISDSCLSRGGLFFTPLNEVLLY